MQQGNLPLSAALLGQEMTFWFRDRQCTHPSLSSSKLPRINAPQVQQQPFTRYLFYQACRSRLNEARNLFFQASLRKIFDFVGP